LVIENSISLKDFNTFGIDAKAAEFTDVKLLDELIVLCQNFNLNSHNLLVIGGGSNLLFTKNYNGLVLKISLKGITETMRTPDYVYVKAMAGEEWHNLVMYCIGNNYGGVENLSLIPGLTGAAPMQNIGAYGVELKDVFEELEAVDTLTGELKVFTNTECKFGYRESIFKNELKGKYIIASITLKLTLHNHRINISYGAINQILAKKGITNPGIKDISDAVIQIRQSKLPNPKVLGNSGSFFKNPEISELQFNALKQQYTELNGYKTDNNTIKIPAGWLIEQCGWKGKVVGNTGAHKDQALVLVNYGNATGEEIYMLALAIQASGKKKFNITIIPEVNII